MMARVWLRYGAAGFDSTGDLVFGDRNGIVVIPEHAAKEVLVATLG